MANQEMNNKRNYIKSLAVAALQSIRYDKTIRPNGLHIYTSMVALKEANDKKPGVFVSVDMSTSTPRRLESGEYTSKSGQAVISVYIEMALKTQTPSGLQMEYDRLQELVEYALESGMPDRVAENDRYIIETDRVCNVGEIPLFDDDAMNGDAQMIFTLNYDITRK